MKLSLNLVPSSGTEDPVVAIVAEEAFFEPVACDFLKLYFVPIFKIILHYGPKTSANEPFGSLLNFNHLLHFSNMFLVELNLDFRR